MDARFDVPFGAQCRQLQQLAIDSEITELKTEGKRSISVIVLFHGNHVVFQFCGQLGWTFRLKQRNGPVISGQAEFIIWLLRSLKLCPAFPQTCLLLSRSQTRHATLLLSAR